MEIWYLKIYEAYCFYVSLANVSQQAMSLIFILHVCNVHLLCTPHCCMNLVFDIYLCYCFRWLKWLKSVVIEDKGSHNTIAWWHTGQGHQQPWYWHSTLGIFIPQHLSRFRLSNSTCGHLVSRPFARVYQSFSHPDMQIRTRNKPQLNRY